MSLVRKAVHVGAGVIYGNFLSLPLNFSAANLKLLQKLVLKKKKDDED